MLLPSILGDNLFDGFWDDFAKPMRSLMDYSMPMSSAMRTDVKETAAGYEMYIDLPGYQKNEIQAELKDGYLIISAASRKDSSETDSNGTYIRRERYYGTCSRSFYVGPEIKKEDVRARFNNGILKLSIPKKQQKKLDTKKNYITIED